VVDDATLNVEPPGELQLGMTIIVTCTVRFGGPLMSIIAADQDPKIELFLENEPLSGQTFYQEPAPNTDNFHQKTLVTWTLYVC